MFKKAFNKKKKDLIFIPIKAAISNETISNIIEERGIVQSISHKGNCLDNAIIKNFFGILKSELFYLKKFNSIDELKNEIKQYIYS